jgi:hypothetical protein
MNPITINTAVTSKTKNEKLIQWTLLAAWFIVNLLQATFTELANDEAYYWVYSKYLDFGYFDHPPVIALMIKIGCALFPNELGVRFFAVFLSSLSVWFLFKLCGSKNFVFFFLLLASISIFETYGFIAVPDVPLLFFTVLFFLFYKQYLEKDDWKNSLLLGLCIVLLLYSKYHGLLIIFFTLLSNIKLLTRKSFYLVVIISVLLYAPHIIWQIMHDYPSYQYHVLNKSQTPYNPGDTINFILGQLLVAGPFVGFFLFYAFFKYKAGNLLEKSLKFTFIGFTVFFLFSTLNTRVEPNWTLSAMVPLLAIAYPYILSNDGIKKWVTRFSFISLIIFVCFRLNLVFNFFPFAGSQPFPEFFNNKGWAENLYKVAGNTPVVFSNTYQKASKYAFYSGQSSMSLNNISYRRNQYDFWPIEDSLQGKRILYIPNWETERPDEFKIKTPKEALFGIFIDNFRSFTKVMITTGNNSYKLKAGSQVTIPITLINQYPEKVQFGLNSNYRDKLVYSLFKEEAFDHTSDITELGNFVLDSAYSTHFVLQVPNEKGVYYLRVSIQSGWMPPLINSHLMRLVIE